MVAGQAEIEVGGARLLPGYLDRTGCERLLAEVGEVIAQAPTFSPETRFGRRMSVAMTSSGRFGWYSDRRGYRYVAEHPVTGRAWPPIPPLALDIWRQVAGVSRLPECCLVNVYRGEARMGLHQDRDEADLTQPVLSISLGDDAVFRVGGTERRAPRGHVTLRSGDVLVLGGTARLAYHGIDRVLPGTSDLIPGGGRINLTLRVVT